MERLWRDVTLGARSLTRTPGFSLVVILTLALGIGGNSAIFGVVNGVLLRPLPVAEPERLTVVWESRVRDGGYMFASPPNYVDWRAENQVFEDLGAFAPRDFLLALETETLRVHGARVSASLFAVLGVPAVAGRWFTEDEDRPGGERVAMISHRLWQANFAGDPDVIGGTIQLGDGAYTLVGVMPENFHFPPPIDLEGRSFPRRNDLWTPLAMEVTNRAQHYLTTIARLRPRVSVESADAGMRTIAERLAVAYPETNRDYRISVVPFERMVIGDMKLALLVLLGGVGLVLLIACVNVANLLMTRFAARQKEYAVRAALGAGRWRIIRHSIVESQLLALAGGLAGLALGSLAVQGILRVAPANVPRLEEVRIDLAVITYTFGISVLTGLVFGLIPVLRALKPDLAAVLRGGGRGAAGSGEQSRLRAALVVAEVSLSLVLLVGAGLLFSSFLALRGVDTGIRAERVLTMRTSLGSARYPELPRVVGTYRAIEESVATLPGVESAGFSYDVPLVSDFQGTRVLIEGDPAPAEGEEPRGHFSITTPAYFETMGIPLVSGRFYRAEDTAESTPVILVNETFARLYFGGREAVGRRIEFQNEMRTIVGVVGDVRLETLTDEPTPAMYVPHAQAPERAMSLIVRAATDPLAIAVGVRDAIRGVDPAAPVYDVRTMEQIVGDTMAQPRFSAFLLIAFSVVALLLAAIGMYGVISFMVTQQTREIGIRLALGARPADELKRVIGGGSRLLVTGAIIGLIVSVLASRVLDSLLFEIDPLDVGTLAWTTVFLLSVGLLACGVPALRASRVAPMEALRYE